VKGSVGGVAEWSIATVLKTVLALQRQRGFESLPLRHLIFVNNKNITLVIWAAIIAGVFFYCWRKGYLLQFRNYILETREELKRCTWPTWAELKGSTLVVMITIILLGTFTVSIDFVIAMLVRWMTLA
jgi:preprotein translocase subunit SecE